MPADDHNRTADFSPPADAHGEAPAPPGDSGPTSLPHTPAPETATTTAPPPGTAAVAPGSLPDIPGYTIEAEIARGGWAACIAPGT